jgi:hypothetical protein
MRKHLAFLIALLLSFGAGVPVTHEAPTKKTGHSVHLAATDDRKHLRQSPQPVAVAPETDTAIWLPAAAAALAQRAPAPGRTASPISSRAPPRLL